LHTLNAVEYGKKLHLVLLIYIYYNSLS